MATEFNHDHDEICAMNEAYFSGKMTAPNWKQGSRAALPDAPAGRPWVGKSVVLDEMDLLDPAEQDGPGDSEQGLALMLARKLYSTDEYLQGDFINMSTGIGVSPEFHIMANLAVGGAMDLRTFAERSAFWPGGYHWGSRNSDKTWISHPETRQPRLSISEGRHMHHAITTCLRSAPASSTEAGAQGGPRDAAQLSV
jgi:hypothetical protein